MNINKTIEDGWVESIREGFAETGVIGAFSVYDGAKNIDHNEIKMIADKQSKAVFREIFKVQLAMVSEHMKFLRDSICATMEEGPVRDSFSNYEFTPDDLDDLFLETMRSEEELINEQ